METNKRKLWFGGLGGFCALMLLLSGGSAQAQNKSANKKLLEMQQYLNARAAAAGKNSDYERAASLFKAALELGELNVSYLNLGRSLYYLGRCEEAREAFNQALTAPGPPNVDFKQVEGRVLEYLADMDVGCPGEVLVSCGEPEMFLEVDGVPGECGQKVTLFPGEHTLTGVVGDQRVEQKVEIISGDRKTIFLGLPKTKEQVAPVFVQPAEPQPVQYEDDRSTPKLLGWTLGGLSMVALGAGVTGWLSYQGAHQDLSEVSSTPGASQAAYDEHKDSLDGARTLMVTSFGVGSILAGVSGYLLYLGYSGSPLEESPEVGELKWKIGPASVGVETKF